VREIGCATAHVRLPWDHIRGPPLLVNLPAGALSALYGGGHIEPSRRVRAPTPSRGGGTWAPVLAGLSLRRWEFPLERLIFQFRAEAGRWGSRRLPTFPIESDRVSGSVYSSRGPMSMKNSQLFSGSPPSTRSTASSVSATSCSVWAAETYMRPSGSAYTPRSSARSRKFASRSRSSSSVSR